MEKSNRIYLFDNLKFLLITAVTVGHFADDVIEEPLFQSLYLFIYVFHMPLFLFISGLFHRNKDIVQKVFSYLFLGYLLKAFLFLVKIILGADAEFSLFSESGVPWFMFALAAFTLIRYLLRDINPWQILFFSICSACLAGYDSSIGDFLCLSRILVFYPFYQLGTMVGKEQILALNHSLLHKTLGALILALGAFVCFFLLEPAYQLRPLFTGRNPFPEDWYPYGGLLRLLCYSLSGLAGYALLCLIPDHRLPLCTTLGCRTIQVYFWHRPVLYLFSFSGLPAAMCASLPGRLLYLGLAVFLSLLLSLRPFAFPTGQLLNFHKKEKANPHA